MTPKHPEDAGAPAALSDHCGCRFDFERGQLPVEECGYHKAMRAELQQRRAQPSPPFALSREAVEAIPLPIWNESVPYRCGFRDALDAVLRLCPADAPRPTHTPDGEEIIGWTAPQPARPIVRAKAKFYPNPEDGADAPAQETTNG